MLITYIVSCAYAPTAPIVCTIGNVGETDNPTTTGMQEIEAQSRFGERWFARREVRCRSSDYNRSDIARKRGVRTGAPRRAGPVQVTVCLVLFDKYI